jgi:hypothetical protein
MNQRVEPTHVWTHNCMTQKDPKARTKTRVSKIIFLILKASDNPFNINLILILKVSIS